MKNKYIIKIIASKIIILIIVIIALLINSCSDDTVDYSDDRGIKLTNTILIDDLVWSNDGNEILFVSPLDGVKAVNVINNTSRVLDIGKIFEGFKLSKDGTLLYYAAGADYYTPKSLYRVTVNSPTPRKIIDSIGVGDGESGLSLALSPDNIHIVYSKAEYSTSPMYYYNIADSSSVYLGNGRPISFSPDGTQLLFLGQYNDANYYIFTFSNNNVQNIGESPGNVIWKSSGIFAFYKYYESPTLYRYYIRNLIANTTTLVWQSGMTGLEIGRWSPDGTKTSAWTGECIKYQGFGCEIYQIDLNIIDINSKTCKRVAYAKNMSSSRKIVFSNDNSKIAYVMDGNIYMKYIN